MPTRLVGKDIVDVESLAYSTRGLRSSASGVEDAKARFSEVVRLAREQGPQRVTVRGQDAVVVLTAIVHGLGVVTRNGADFERAGVALIKPWVGTHR